jgi:hypothetical protein
MAPGETADDEELELDEKGFAGPARPVPRRNGNGQSNVGAVNGGANGATRRRLENGVQDVQSELVRLRAENARLRAVAGLEARRDEPATVGDLIDANIAQADFVRAEVERAIDEHGEELAEYIAECVERRLLEPLGLADDDGGTGDGGQAAKRKPAGKRAEKPKRRGLRKGELFYEADGSGPFAFRGDEEDEVDDDGRRHAFD